ncbi:MAG: T9SS type A sorting domain-containing protein [Bacteroidota bacterium]
MSTELSVDAGEAGHHSITIYNSLGENVKQISATGKTTSINVSGLPAGVYFVKVVTEKGVVSEKIILQ